MSVIGAVIGGISLAPFLNTGDPLASFQILDSLPWSIDLWKIISSGASLGRGKEGIYKWPRSHDRDGSNAHIW